MYLELAYQQKTSNNANDVSSSKQHQLGSQVNGTRTDGFPGHIPIISLPVISKVWSMAPNANPSNQNDWKKSQADEPQPSIPVVKTEDDMRIISKNVYNSKKKLFNEYLFVCYVCH